MSDHGNAGAVPDNENASAAASDEFGKGPLCLSDITGKKNVAGKKDAEWTMGMDEEGVAVKIHRWFPGPCPVVGDGPLEVRKCTFCGKCAEIMEGGYCNFLCWVFDESIKAGYDAIDEIQRVPAKESGAQPFEWTSKVAPRFAKVLRAKGYEWKRATLPNVNFPGGSRRMIYWAKQTSLA